MGRCLFENEDGYIRMYTYIVNMRSSNGGLYSTEVQRGLISTTCKRQGGVMVQLTLVGIVVMALPDSNPAKFVTYSQIRYNFKLWLYERSSSKSFLFYCYLDQFELTMINDEFCVLRKFL